MKSQNLSEKQIITTIQGIMYTENQTVIIETMIYNEKALTSPILP